MNIRTIVLIVVVVIAFFIFNNHTITPAVSQPTSTVAYACSVGKGITAAYYAGKAAPAVAPGQPPVPTGSVALSLSDGRTMTLPRTISADGIRYANTDESFVFWSKGNGALVLENGQEKSYIGCIAVAPEPIGQNLSQVYSSAANGFSIRLPSGYEVDEKYRYQELGPGKDIAGIKFTIAASVATGTNLAPDSYVSIEQIPQTQNCTATPFLDHGTVARTISEGNVTYSVASSTGAAAGNRYEETIYALPGTNPCIAVRYFIHYGVFQNYPAGAVREFDQRTLLAQFDAIRRALIIVQ